MSRSTPVNTLVNPAKMFLDWDSEKGQFKYWDKTKKENKALKLPVKFYILDELTTVKGFSDKHQGGIWSNEVKNTVGQKLKVVGKGKDGKLFKVAHGIYQDIKDAITAAGGKYTRSLYVAMLNDNDEYEIVNFQLRGAAFSGWIAFCDEVHNQRMVDEVVCADFKKEKKGATKYTIPIFSLEKASEEGNEAAIALDVELQQYLREYFEKTQAEVEYVNDTGVGHADDGGETDQNLPF